MGTPPIRSPSAKRISEGTQCVETSEASVRLDTLETLARSKGATNGPSIRRGTRTSTGAPLTLTETTEVVVAVEELLVGDVGVEGAMLLGRIIGRRRISSHTLEAKGRQEERGMLMSPLTSHMITNRLRDRTVKHVCESMT